MRVTSTTLRVADLAPGVLEVMAFRCRERLSEPYELAVDVTSATLEPLEDLLPGRAAALLFAIGERRRAFHGVVSRVRALGHRRGGGGGRVGQYRIEIAPRLWLLGLRRTSRIFQALRVDEVVRRVLDEHAIPSRWVLERRYPARELLTQYEETDLDFVRRLLAETGIFFHFLQPAPPELASADLGAAAPREVVIFSDAAVGYTPMTLGDPPRWEELSRAAGAGPEAAARAPRTPATLRVRDVDLGDPEGDRAVTAFERVCDAVSELATFRDYDPRRPTLTLAAGAAVGESGAPAPLPSIAGADLGRERPFELYEHHGPMLAPDWEYEAGEPVRMLRSARRRRDVASGESLCPWLSPGHVFELEGHELGRLDRAWVPVEVVHEAHLVERAGEPTYRCRFECVPDDVPYPPPRPPRRFVNACLTATVTGAGDAGIHGERGGHIRVRFHWDRAQGRGDDSCWIRAMQPWAGAGFGWQFIPRAGMEVVVGFEGGDPDKPIALGCVYNGTSPPPFALPQHATRSGLRTRSTSGSGANELWFDDAAGDERVHLYAHRDLEMHAHHDRVTHVDRDDLVTVTRDRRVRVDGATAFEGRGPREVRLAGDDRLEVSGQRTVSVEGRSRETVAGDREVTVAGTSRTELTGVSQLVARADVVERIEGNRVTVVGRAGAPRSCATHVEGELRTSASERIELRATQEILIACGQSTLRLSPDRIEVRSPELALFGEGARLRLMSGELRAQADEKAQIVADKAIFKASGASLGLSSEAKLDGSKILLNSPSDAEDTVEETRIEPTVLELCDDAGDPIPNHPYRVIFADGREIAGALDAEGRAELELEEDAEVVFPGLSGTRRS